MRALITASFDPAARARLERLTDVLHEDWRERHHISFDGAAFMARAALTDEDALHDALPNVIAAPHVGGATVDVVRHRSDQIIDSIERHLRGEQPRWIANPAVYERR